MRGKREALRSREGAARFGQNKNPVTGRLQGFLLAAGEGFELSKRVKLRKTEQKKALIINTFLKLTEITDKGK